MAVNDVLKSFNSLKILSKSKPVFFYDFVTQVVNEILYEVNHALVQQVGRREKWQESAFGLLQRLPQTVQLPLNEFTPKHKPEKHLVFRHAVLVKYQSQRKLAFVI